MTSIQIRKLKQEVLKQKKRIRDKNKAIKKDNAKQNKLYPKPNENKT